MMSGVKTLAYAKLLVNYAIVGFLLGFSFSLQSQQVVFVGVLKISPKYYKTQSMFSWVYSKNSTALFVMGDI